MQISEMNSYFPNNYSPSYWDYDALLPDKVDFCIIGAGFTGIGMAMGLWEKHPHASILLLEQLPIGSAASTRNAGFLCFGSPTEILDTVDDTTYDEAFELIEQRWKGSLFLKKICKNLNVPISTHGAYEIFRQMSDLSSTSSQLQNLNKSLSAIHPQLQWHERCAPWAAPGKALYCPAESRIHPGKLWYALVKHLRKLDIETLHNFTLNEYRSSGNSIELTINNDRQIHTDVLLLTTNAFLKGQNDIQAARNIVLLYEQEHNIDLKSNIHYDKGYVYMCGVNSYFLIGGGRNIDMKNEATEKFGDNPAIRKYLQDCLDELVDLPVKRKPIYQWSGIITSGKNGAPIWKRIDKNVYYAGRYGGMGVALSLHHGYQSGLNMEIE